MKKIFIIVFLFVAMNNSLAQTFTYYSTDTIRNYQLAAVETFYVPVINITSSPINIFAARKLINVPPNWITSICFDGTCFADFVDSVATTPDFGFPSLAPGDTLLLGLHFFTDSSNASGNATMVVGNLDNPGETQSLTFYLTNDPLAVDENILAEKNFVLYQNYPNPFNPSTIISYRLSASGNVSLKVFDILGNEIATLIDNDFKEAGYYNYLLSTVNFPLSSGIYFYRLQAGNFVQTKKMILLR